MHLTVGSDYKAREGKKTINDNSNFFKIIISCKRIIESE
jgi:hypothetical protein